MNQLIVWEIIDNFMSLCFILLGFYACSLEKTNLYDRFLFLLVVNISFKIVIFSYYLSFPSAYIAWCISMNKVGLYPFMLIDGVAFLFFLYIGVKLRSYLSSNYGFYLVFLIIF